MLVFPSTGESEAPGSKKRVALSALSLHLTGLVSQYHLFIENTRDILRACGVSTVTSLTSQKGPFAVCAASPMCSREPWVSEASALLLRHSDPTPPHKDRQTWSLPERITIGATLISPSKWNSSGLLHTSTAISHTLALGQVQRY